MEPKKLPIGYWVKKVDELLVTGINEVQSSFGLTREGWQALHSIHESGQINRRELETLLKPFAGATLLDTILTKFKDDNLVNEEAGIISLTQNGIGLHSACFAEQKTFRQKAMAGIPEKQYLETISTLEKIVQNLTAEDEKAE